MLSRWGRGGSGGGGGANRVYNYMVFPAKTNRVVVVSLAKVPAVIAITHNIPLKTTSLYRLLLRRSGFQVEHPSLHFNVEWFRTVVYRVKYEVYCSNLYVKYFNSEL